MDHYDLIDALSFKNSWLTIGIFDGVHRGHQEVLRRLVSGAHEAGSLAVVLTFHPHPAIVLGGKTDFKYLNTPTERVQILSSLGVNIVITQTFNQSLADQTALEFMQRLSCHVGLTGS